MEKVTIGIIGAGNVAKIHIKNIISKVPSAIIKYVADPFPKKYNDWASKLEYPVAFEDYKLILKDPEVNAVIICAPAAVHGDLIIASAKAGKHIFCEKPFDYSVEKIVEAMNVVEECKVKLQIGFNRRFDHNFARAKQYVEEGKIGDIHIIRITARDPIPPVMEYFTAPGGENCSIYTDTTIHDFDMARFLNNCEVTEVYAMGSKLINKDKDEITRHDTCVISMRFEDNSLAVIDNSWEAVYGYDQRAEIFGTKGSVTIENDIISNTTLNTREGIIGEKPLVNLEQRFNDSFAEEIRAFVEAIQNDTEVKVSGMDGLMSIVIAKAARKSSEENRPVKISELLPSR